MTEVLYVRNTRPNAVLVKHNGIKYTVERRGSREDTVTLPADAKDDPTVANFLQKGILEEISKEAFMRLGERSEGRAAFALKKSGEEVNLPHSGETAREPFVLADKVIDESKYLRTPRPEFAERVPSTAEELATGIRNTLPELQRNLSSLSTKEERLETQVSDLTSQVAALSKLVEQQMALIQQQSEAENTVKEEETAPKKVRASNARKKNS